MEFKFHVYVHNDEFVELAKLLIDIRNEIMASIDQLAQEIADETTLIDGVSTLVSGLQQQLSDALSGAQIPPQVQAKIDAVFVAAEANKAKLTRALAAGTPADGVSISN